MMCHFDFEYDLKQEIHTIFDDYGVKIPIRNDICKILLDYLTILKKLVNPIPRQVLYSPVILNKLDNHSKFQQVKHLEGLFTQGKDVNYYQSKRLFETRFHDHLLYEWNIYHFHLGNEYDKKSNFIKQTDLMLFVYITDNKAVFLDIDHHRDGLFGDEKWIGILHDYFPELIKQYANNKIKNIHPIVDSVGRQTLWDKGYVLGMIKIRDIVYHSPGVGRTTSGHSILVSLSANDILRWLYKIKEQFSVKASTICKICNLCLHDIEPKLVIGNITFEIIDNKSKTRLLLFPNIFIFND